jgi:hypothetical protein
MRFLVILAAVVSSLLIWDLNKHIPDHQDSKTVVRDSTVTDSVPDSTFIDSVLDSFVYTCNYKFGSSFSHDTSCVWVNSKFDSISIADSKGTKITIKKDLKGVFDRILYINHGDTLYMSAFKRVEWKAEKVNNY